MAKKTKIDTAIDTDVEFLEYLTLWLRGNIAKRALAYQPHNKFTHSQPQGNHQALLTLELNPKYKNIPGTSAKTSFAITDNLQVIAWNPDNGVICNELIKEASTFAQGVHYIIKLIFFTNMEYAVEVLHMSPRPRPLTKPNVIKLQKADKPQPITSWQASTKAFLNYTMHGILEHSSLLSISHHLKSGSEDFNLLSLDDSIKEIFQIGSLLLQIADKDKVYFGRFKLKNPKLKIQTRDNLQWKPLTTETMERTASQITLAIFNMSSIIFDTIEEVECTQQDWFNLSTEELYETYDTDYFQVVWKFR
jgi:hypothetical protein